jgi:hypothetical protein
VKVKCEGCGGFHDVSPTAMAVIISAFQDGDLQEVTGEGVNPLCLGGAFTPETMEKWRRRMATKTVVTFDEDRWTQEKVA